VRVTPNRAAAPNTIQLGLTRNGQPLRGAEVVNGFTMLDMEMGSQSYAMKETAPGVYTVRSAPALLMVGHWALSFEITPPGKPQFTVLLVDRANG
jgi:copper transport protein